MACSLAFRSAAPPAEVRLHVLHGTSLREVLIQRNMQVSLGLMAITMVRFAEVIRHAAAESTPHIAIAPSF